MKVSFADERLRDLCAGPPRRLVQKYGHEQAKKIAQRLQQLRVADNLLDVAAMGGRLHALSADRAGFLALDLKHPYRLVFEPDGGPDGVAREHWGRIQAVTITEVIDYH